MIILTVMYPKSEQSRFDFDYYLQKHIPLVKARLEKFGLEDLQLMRGTGTLDGGAPAFEVVAQLAFSSSENLRDSLSNHGEEIIADISNFTNVNPAIQINEPLVPMKT
jgi:uncharacterized protein (TIGR02118 family)